jgi:hypothetical protein
MIPVTQVSFACRRRYSKKGRKCIARVCWMKLP